MSVEADDIVVAVDHRDPATEYPVLVDPITESWQGAEWENCGSQAGSGAWEVYTFWGVPSAGHFFHSCNWAYQGGYGMYTSPWDGNTYPSSGSGNAGHMTAYSARPNTYISDVTWGGWRHGSSSSHAFVGLMSTYGSSWQAMDWSYTARSAQDLGQHTNDAAQNRAIFGVQIPSPTVTSNAFAGVTWVAMWIRDGQAPDPPIVTAPSATNSNGELYFPWSSSAPSMEVRTRDVGVGVRSVRVKADDGRILWGPVWFASNAGLVTEPDACYGTRNRPCPTEALSGQRAFTGSALREGDNVGRVVVTDAAGLETTGQRIHVRYSPPAIETALTFSPARSLDDVTAQIQARNGRVVEWRTTTGGFTSAYRPTTGQTVITGANHVRQTMPRVAAALRQFQNSPDSDDGAYQLPGIPSSAPGDIAVPVVTGVTVTGLSSAQAGALRSSSNDSAVGYPAASGVDKASDTPAASQMEESSANGVSPEAARGSVTTDPSASAASYARWSPKSGRVIAAPSDGMASIVHSMRWAWQSDVFEFAVDHAYEHDFKLVNRANSSALVHPFCGGQGNEFWADRTKQTGDLWVSDFPDYLAPYFDTDASDSCEYEDFTIGLYRPRNILPSKRYHTWLVTDRGTKASSPFILSAQRLGRELGCYNPWCVGGAFGNHGYQPLVGESRGTAPGCRHWHRGRSSKRCED